MLVVAKIKNNKIVNKKSIYINNSLNGEPSDLCIAFSALPKCPITSIMLLLEKGRRDWTILGSDRQQKKKLKKER